MQSLLWRTLQRSSLPHSDSGSRLQVIDTVSGIGEFQVTEGRKERAESQAWALKYFSLEVTSLLFIVQCLKLVTHPNLTSREFGRYGRAYGCLVSTNCPWHNLITTFKITLSLTESLKCVKWRLGAGRGGEWNFSDSTESSFQKPGKVRF